MSQQSHHGLAAAGRVETIALGLIFVVANGALGALLGGAYVRFLMPPAVDGWTGIGNGLGGLMTGGLLAIVLAGFLVAPLTRRGARTLALATAAASSAAALLLFVLYLTSPQRPQQDDPEGKKPTPTRSP